MRIAAGMLVKDEADVIAGTIENLLEQGVDTVYVLDNGSLDGTIEILDRLSMEGLPVWMRFDPVVAYFQSDKVTGLMLSALAQGHDWFVPCDADELWYGDGRSLRDVLESKQGRVDVVGADLYDYVCSGRDNLDEADPFARIRWRRPERGLLPKVAVRCSEDVVIEMGNHGAHSTRGRTLTRDNGLRIRHYPYRSAAQFVRKARNGAAAYAAAGDRLDEGYGIHWRAYGRVLDEHGEGALIAHFREHFVVPDPEGVLRYDPA